MDTGWDLLASSSIVVSAQIRFTFGFGFLLKVPSLLSVAHTVSAECDASLSAYFRLFPVFSLSCQKYFLPWQKPNPDSGAIYPYTSLFPMTSSSNHGPVVLGRLLD